MAHKFSQSIDHSYISSRLPLQQDIVFIRSYHMMFGNTKIVILVLLFCLVRSEKRHSIWNTISDFVNKYNDFTIRRILVVVDAETLNECYNFNNSCSWVMEVTNGSLNYIVQMTTAQDVPLIEERDTLILFEGSTPQSIHHFQDKISSTSSSSLRDNVWMLVINGALKSDMESEFPLLAKSQNIRLDSQVYAVTLNSGTIALYEMYRIWFNTPLLSSCVLRIRNVNIDYQSDFIWNRRRNLQGLSSSMFLLSHKLKVRTESSHKDILFLQ